MVSFEYRQYYLNKKEKTCKARVTKWRIIKNNSFKKVLKMYSMQVSGDFSKKCNYRSDLTNFSRCFIIV